jgi:SulP family sulfate permease
MPTGLEPQLVSLVREGYSRGQFLQDLLAGIVVGIVAFPLAIAFAIASGVRPEQGLFTAVVAGFLISALSGSRVQIGGPTGAFVVLIFGVVQRFGYDGLAVATLMAGVLLIALGVARMGVVIRFVPYPVTVGFTSGIALIIAAAQVRDALGLQMAEVPAEFIQKWIAYARHFDSIEPSAILLCAATVAIVQLWPRLAPRLPGPLVAVVLTAAAARLLALPAETIGSRFGVVPTALPLPRLPHVDWALLPQLVSPAISIALLGGIESLLSAVVADGMTGRRHRSNAELVAQGIANIASPLFGGIPATGAIARTATNVKNGGRTPVAGMVHAATLLLVLMVAGKWAALIPMATLAGILLVVAYNMSEWHLFARLLRGPRSDILVLLATFLLTVFVDLIVAIQVGVVLAALLFMRRMAAVTQVRVVTDQLSEDEPQRPDQRRESWDVPAGVEVFEIRGAFFFGSAQTFSEVIGRVQRRPRVVILRMRDVLAMDATGLRALDEIAAQFRRQGTDLLLSGVRLQPLDAMLTAGLVERVGEENMFASFAAALDRARVLAAIPG